MQRHLKASFERLKRKLSRTSDHSQTRADGEMVCENRRYMEFRQHLEQKYFPKSLERNFYRAWQAWQQNPARSTALRVVSDLLLQHNPTTGFGNAVCVGGGSIEREAFRFFDDTDTDVHSRGPWRQVMLFLDIIDLLQARSCPKPAPQIYGYVHDPDFTPSDISFLGKLGLIVVSQEKARSLITTNSFLFAPFLPWNALFQKYLPGRSPSLFIGCSLHLLLPLHFLKYASIERIADPVSNEHHALAMRAVRDDFMDKRTVEELVERTVTTTDDDLRGLDGLFAFVKYRQRR